VDEQTDREKEEEKERNGIHRLPVAQVFPPQLDTQQDMIRRSTSFRRRATSHFSLGGDDSAILEDGDTGTEERRRKQ
jgi:hypothetical protein